MAKYKYILTVIITLCTLITYAQPAQYTPMTAAGYQMKRLKVDSTLHLPSFCGVPTLRNSTAKDGALAIDTCGAILYMWSNQGGWDTVNTSGGGGPTDTTSLSNRINQRIDSLRRSTDSVFARKNGTFVFQYKDSIGGGGISGTGSQYYVPKFSNSTTLQNSQIFDSVNVGINTISPAYKLDVNGTARVKSLTSGEIFIIQDSVGNNTFRVKNDSTFITGGTMPLTIIGNSGIQASIGNNGFLCPANISRLNAGVLNFYGNNNDGIGFDYKFNNSQQSTSVTSAMINLGGVYNNQQSFAFSNLLISPTYNFDLTNVTTSAIARGVYYNPTIPLNGLRSAKHIAFESTSGNVVMKGLKTSNSTTDSIAIWINDTLSKAPYPSGNNSSDTAKVVIAQVHNATATTLLKGEVVYLFSSNGNVASVKRANNKQDSTSARTIGIVRSNITAGSNGFITTQGQVEKLNLGSYTEGDVLWLDSLDGQFTKVKPQAPYHGVFLGVVERANNGNGLAYIKIQNGVELNEVHDVQINNILNNQIIVYSDTQKVWKNRNIYSIVDTVSLSNRINLKLNSADTASLSNRINLKLNISDTSTMLSKYLRKTDTASLSNRINLKLNSADTASLSNRINLKLNITDTTVFQKKSLSANTIMANNTASTANATAQAFKDTSGTYNGTIIWTGTAPTGATNHSFRLTQVGKCVTLHIALVYATNGVLLTAVQMTLPAGAPTPVQPAGLTGSIFNMYPVSSQIVNSVNQSILGSAIRGYLRNNTAANGFEIFLTFNSAAVGQAGVIVQYWTN